ncbi:polyphosphate kinase [Thermonema lapsum]|uniref:Polyphosphate kinase n=1 Tax=Thermonema lapsum TaxID=28195 RepID=A0A846MN84_9BACT|nr:polyphosphate kinase 1 [Thermonema lapsum]NIK72921.1 polyphosphate kinase [Thermonema lapsum]
MVKLKESPQEKERRQETELDPKTSPEKGVFSANTHQPSYPDKRLSTIIDQSRYISRDLSWLKFNERVLDQCRSSRRNLFEKCKFLAISASNLDEFFTIRVGSLYNYLDYDKERLDYSGLRERPFRATLLSKAQEFVKEQYQVFAELKHQFKRNGFSIVSELDSLLETEQAEIRRYFERTLFPMLTPMVFDSFHAFPILRPQSLIFGVVTINPHSEKRAKKASFIQVPQNLPRFYVIERGTELLFIPIEEIIRKHIESLYRNVKILSVDVFRITRNGDFTLDESDDMEADFIEEVRQKLKTRRTGRVVRLEIQPGFSKWLVNILIHRWDIDHYNIFEINELLDLTALWEIIKHPEFKTKLPVSPAPVLPLGIHQHEREADIFELIRQKDILLHHPYNSFEWVLRLLEEAAEDPNVLSIKMTIYRLSRHSRVTEALLKAAENGKHVSALFELKARFDEENNIREAQRLQKAGCYIIYGIGGYKTHTKLLQIVRKENDEVRRYIHITSGNYNEDTARLYTDVGLLSANETYAQDVSEFFNAITGHSIPNTYRYLITSPHDMRQALIQLIRQEAENAKQGKPSGICIKINSLEDRIVIDELYAASQAGVPVKLIVRGICCLRPQRAGLSDNIAVRSIVGDYLEHSRLYYFHNAGEPLIYGGSADVMVRSFERRIESLFLIVDPLAKQQAIYILASCWRDNVNAYEMQEDGSYVKIKPKQGERLFNVHKEFYRVTEKAVTQAKLFD